MILTGSCIVLALVPAQAIEVFDSEADFLANAPIVSTAEFSADTTAIKFFEPRIAVDDVIYEVSAGRGADCYQSGWRPCWSINEDQKPARLSSGAFNAIGMDEWWLGQGEWDIIRFDKNRSVQAFGFYLQGVVGTTPKNYHGWEILVHENDGRVIAIDVRPPRAGKPAYVGIISNVGISMIDVGAKPGSMTLNWAYARVSRSAVEEKTPYDEAITQVISAPPQPIEPNSLDNDNLERRNEIYYDHGSKSPATGIVVTWHPNGKKSLEAHLKDGKKNGPEIHWHPNGKLDSQKTYIANRRHGLEENWYDDGRPKAVVNYSYGRRHGASTWWHANGQMEGKQNYIDGRMQGVETWWHANGQVSSKTTMVDGMPEGILTKWHANGKKKFEVTYKAGRKDGLAKSWHESGELESEINFLNGQCDGLAVRWYANGQKELEQRLDNGKRVGLQTQWYEGGQLKAEINFVSGKMDGSAIWWSANGQKELEMNFKDGKLHGRGTIWHPNGQMKSDGEFKNGKAAGRHKFWDENGRKLRSRPRNYPEIPKVT